MSLSTLLSQLSAFDPELPLVFTADGVAARGGYHVTEFQIARIQSMTCNGATDAWEEARVQIVDGADLSGNMSVGHFLNIAAQVQARYPEMFALDVKVEFAPGNAGLHVYHLDPPALTAGAVTVPLVSSRAVCKPLMTTSCCGAGEACCAA